MKPLRGPEARHSHRIENRPDRRSALLWSAGALVGSGALTPTFAPRRRAASSRPDPRTLDELASALLQAQPDAALPLVAEAIAAGVDRVTLFGAVLLAGVRAMRPRVVGSEFHIVLTIESALRVTDGAPARDAWLLLLFAVDDFENAVRNARRRGTGPLEDAPQPLTGAAARDARAELVRALEAFDPEAADRAATTLHRQGRTLDAFDALRLYGARSFQDAGHRILFTAQSERAVRRIGVEHVEPVVRSLAIALASDARGPQTASFEYAQELAASLPKPARAHADQPDESVAVLRAVRGKPREESQRAVRSALDEGLVPERIWDGLALYAAELMQTRPDPQRAFPVHTATELESLGAVAARERDPVVRRLLLLQAAGWLVEAREAIVRNNGPYGAGSILELGAELDPARAPDLGAAVRSRSLVQVHAALQPAAVPLDAYAALLRAGLVRGADQDHQVKLAAALLEAGARVHPHWRARVLACGFDYVPSPDVEESEVHARSLHALRAAGVV